MTTQHDLARAAFHEASFIIKQSGVGRTVDHWLDDHARGSLPLLDLDATVALTGWLAAALAGLPLTEENAANLVNLYFDEYEVSEREMREFTTRFLWTLKQSWPVIDENAAQP
ncbi:hypothetical protein [Microbacterium sp. ANT_H45B]|uniref:hypothetical protein n=1 Tax=Microbacterium sp. ANT_H45B TaxID=2597346 RepID=UPI00165E6E41|nr:hypothetical protein [Microbacterium sp. ANT_H45B]